MTDIEASRWDELDALSRGFRYDIVSSPRAVKLLRARAFLDSIAHRHPEWIVKRFAR